MRPDRSCPEFSEAISVQRMRESDAYTIEHFVPGRELMHRAAQGVFDAVDWGSRSVAIFVGGGNNGGDGYALAGIMARRGMRPKVLRTSAKLSPDGAFYCEEALRLGVAVEDFSEKMDLSGFEVIVDCILGTGFSGVPRGMAAAAIRRINQSDAFVVSVDINSGLDGDTGEAVLAVRSDRTVSIGFYKTGLFLGQAPELIGDLTNVDIGIKLI